MKTLDSRVLMNVSAEASGNATDAKPEISTLQQQMEIRQSSMEAVGKEGGEK